MHFLHVFQSVFLWTPMCITRSGTFPLPPIYKHLFKHRIDFIQEEILPFLHPQRPPLWDILWWDRKPRPQPGFMVRNGQKSLETHQIILFRELLSVFYCQASFPIILEMPRSGFFPPPCPKLTLTETLPWGEFITRAMRLLLSIQTHPPLHFL